MKKYLIKWYHCHEIPKEIIHKLDRIMSERPVIFTLKYTGATFRKFDVIKGVNKSSEEAWVCFDKLIIRVTKFESKMNFKQCDTSLFGYKLLTNYYGEDTEVIVYWGNPDFLLNDWFLHEEDSLDTIKLKILLHVSGESGWVVNS